MKACATGDYWFGRERGLFTLDVYVCCLVRRCRVTTKIQGSNSRRPFGLTCGLVACRRSTGVHVERTPCSMSCVVVLLLLCHRVVLVVGPVEAQSSRRG
eukprot:3101072-Rhodomonas_salina.4